MGRGMRRWPEHSTPHFLFGLAEKKTGRGRSKRKERQAPNLRLRASWLKTGAVLNRFRPSPGSLLPPHGEPWVVENPPARV